MELEAKEKADATAEKEAAADPPGDLQARREVRARVQEEGARWHSIETFGA